jgi:hypothetical protein
VSIIGFDADRKSGVQIEVLDGKVTFHSTKSGEIKANEKEIYFFDGSGRVIPKKQYGRIGPFTPPIQSSPGVPSRGN